MNSLDDFSDDDTLVTETFVGDDALDPLVERFYDTFGSFGLFHRGRGFQSHLREVIRNAFFAGFCDGRQSGIADMCVLDDEQTLKDIGLPPTSSADDATRIVRRRVA